MSNIIEYRKKEKKVYRRKASEYEKNIYHKTKQEFMSRGFTEEEAIKIANKNFKDDIHAHKTKTEKFINKKASKHWAKNLNDVSELRSGKFIIVKHQ